MILSRAGNSDEPGDENSPARDTSGHDLAARRRLVAFADPILSIHGRLTLNLLGFRVDVKKLSSSGGQGGTAGGARGESFPPKRKLTKPESPKGLGHEHQGP